MKRLYTVNIEYADGKKSEEKNVYKVETDMRFDDQPIIIVYHDRESPRHYPLSDGVSIKVTEEPVKTP